MQLPKKWTELYRQGTPEGDIEQKLFIYLSREAKYTFNSVADVALRCKLSKEEVEKIISKYAKCGMLIQNPKNEDQWGYWERCRELLPEKQLSLSEKDQKKRIASM